MCRLIDLGPADQLISSVYTDLYQLDENVSAKISRRKV